MSTYQLKRKLKSYWREDGNARLKGLLLAHPEMNTSWRPSEVAKAWPSKGEREQQLRHAPERALTAPLAQQYAPGAHEDFANTNESAHARTLAREHLDGTPDDPESEAGRFLAGDAAMDKDEYIKRALLMDSVTELDVLFREELETTIIQGAAPRKIARDAANVFNVSNRKGDLPRGSDEGFASLAGQGDPIETGQKGYDTVAYTAEKYATGFEVTDELNVESEPDVVEDLARAAGARVENAVNRVFLNELVDNANQEHDTAGSNQDATMVNLAIEQVELQDFMTDTAVMHPEFKTDLFEDTNLAYANRAGSDDTIRNREFSPLFGLEMFTASDGVHNSSNQTWGFNADAEIGAVVYQREHIALVVWNDFDMETRDYEDPIRDLQGANVRTWVDAVYRQSDAAARIEY